MATTFVRKEGVPVKEPSRGPSSGGDGDIRRGKSDYRPPAQSRGLQITDAIRDLVECYERVAASEGPWSRFKKDAKNSIVILDTNSALYRTAVESCQSWQQQLADMTAALIPRDTSSLSSVLAGPWTAYRNADDQMRDNMQQLENLVNSASAPPVDALFSHLRNVCDACDDACTASRSVREGIHKEIRSLVDELDGLLAPPMEDLAAGNDDPALSPDDPAAPPEDDTTP